MSKIERQMRVYVLEWLLRGMVFDVRVRHDPIMAGIYKDFAERGVCAVVEGAAKYPAGALILPDDNDGLRATALAELRELKAAA